MENSNNSNNQLQSFISTLKPLALVLLALLIILALPLILQEFGFNFSQKDNLSKISPETETPINSSDSQILFSQVNPEEGYTIKAKYGNIGPKLLESGAIDFEKFKDIYARSGSPLTEEQIKILTQGADKEITVNQDNAHFLLNFFWALGLANKNPILDKGAITKYGQDQIGSFASTGGWTIGTKDTMDFYSKSEIILLNQEQQAKVDEVTNNVFRPCCNNSTAFPDCNHGMALLGVLELMAANDASVSEMYEAAKYFNGFWFPQQYFDLALYFKAKDGLDFKDVDPKIIVGPEYSSGSGFSKTKKWLSDNNLIEKAPQGGGSCGV
ncbi:MAG: hypothetical protein A3E90_03075 [Candidatus Portnoybacteria bacterium RIFCSPHIGHO2_12_FULL_40_11]|uniref:Uncharacterized protein n=1 Tax=Candidatus Portnoybacteria bacterium RIFCSPHIGHO2_12_FULL_40_11 TaxID=1801998 RepID=A0A1G2FN44_9BACT|nr:MAG: hypothetical protein A3E90_03075 [Candidatus Portnoybacteria bacterium RIFCSPHIGHO2_12_FULL_40_11]